jgi:hypothetical protein
MIISDKLHSNGTAQLLEQFRDKYFVTDPIECETIDITTLLEPKISKLQSKLTAYLHKHNMENINKDWPIKDINILHLASQEGGIIITALPTYKDFRILLPHYFRERLLMRFGMPYDAIPAGRCHCDNKHNYQIDRQGYHLLSVCNVGNQRQTTHNAVVQQLCSMLSHAGIINRIEDTQVMQSVDINSQKRMDITADNFLPGTSLNIDVSVTDPRQICLATAIPGKAADTCTLRPNIQRSRPNLLAFCLGIVWSLGSLGSKDFQEHHGPHGTPWIPSILPSTKESNCPLLASQNYDGYAQASLHWNPSTHFFRHPVKTRHQESEKSCDTGCGKE